MEKLLEFIFNNLVVIQVSAIVVETSYYITKNKNTHTQRKTILYVLPENELISPISGQHLSPDTTSFFHGLDSLMMIMSSSSRI